MNEARLILTVGLWRSRADRYRDAGDPDADSRAAVYDTCADEVEWIIGRVPDDSAALDAALAAIEPDPPAPS